MNRSHLVTTGRWALGLVAALLLSIAPMGTPPVGAQGTATDPAEGATTSFGFSVQPFSETGAQRRDALEYQMSPDETITDRVTVVNQSEVDKEFFLYAADAINSSVGGGFALMNRTDPAVDAASWITLPADRYTVPAGSAAIVPLEITVPPDAEPGDHAAAVVAEEILPPDATSTPGVLTVRRVGARVYIRVVGPTTPSLQVQAISVDSTNPLAPWKSGTATVTYTVANTGNTRIRINEIRVKISGLLGLGGTTVVHDRGENAGLELPDALLPGNTALFSDTVDGVPSLFLMTASVNVSGEDPVLQTPVATSSSKVFWQVPWVLLGVIALIVAGLAGWAWRRRVAAATAATASAAPPADENVPV